MARRVNTVAAVGLAGLAFVPAAAAQAPAAETPTPDAVTTAQATPTPTPTPTATPAPDGEPFVGKPPEDASKEVRRVYRDFRRGGVLTPCKHTLKTLRETRDTVPEQFESEFPDFYESVRASIEELRADDCDEPEEQEAERDTRKDGASGDEVIDPRPRANAAPPAGSAPPAPAPLPPDPLPSDPLPLDPLPLDPLPADPAAPLAPDPLPDTEVPAPLPVPPAATPVPAAPLPPPTPVDEAVTATVAPEPADPPAPVWGLAAGGGLLTIGGLLTPLVRSRGGARLAGFRHAWAEAGFRVRGAWMDFRDWLRVGR